MKYFTISIVLCGLLVYPFESAASSFYSNEMNVPLFGLFKKKKNDHPEEKKDSASTRQKNYDSIVGSETVSQDGLLKVHKKKTDYYFEIPLRLLNRDLLIVNKIQKAPQSLNEAGLNNGINYENGLVRFELDRENEKVMIRNVFPKPFYPEGDAIGLSVEKNFISPLIEGFKIEAFNADSSAVVVKVNDVYNGAETSINNIFNALNFGTSAIKNLSKIVSVKAFENNVIVHSELTTKVSEGMNSVYITVEISSSLVLLPETPMTGRFENDKVGYFATSRLFFSDKQHQVEKKELITRWRMEPKEEDVDRYLSGVLVEPAKPICFYIDPSTPPQWRQYIKEGVENWQVAFEKAGFKNAILAKDLPDSVEADVDDINYSLITYVASPKVNAMGPSVYDPRSGEIIEADVIWWHNVMSMLQQWIMTQTGAVDPAARQLPLPEERMGEAIRFVACHEVGHSLGLRHNMMGSWAFPTDSLRSQSFTDKMKSTSSSIMDYARFNYVAQPGDGVRYLSPAIGPYDLFAIEYGYRWTGKKTPQEDEPFLFDLLERHGDRLYLYSEAQDSRDAVDPRAQNEDLGDDPVKSSLLGIANLKQIMPHVVDWTTTGEQGQGYLEAGRLYLAIIHQWNNYLYHVLANIGGMYMENVTVNDGKKRYAFVEKEKQQASLDFLIREVFTTPDWLFKTPLSDYVYPTQSSPMGFIENSPSLMLQNAQSYLFWDILNNKRLMRMLENENVNGEKAFTTVQLLDGLHRHLFGVVERGGVPDIDLRSLQKGYVDALILSVSKENTNKETKKLTGEHFLLCEQEPACSCHAHEQRLGRARALAKAPNFYGSYATRISDAISVKRGELLRIKDLIKRRMNATPDVAARYHYKDLELRINAALGIQ